MASELPMLAHGDNEQHQPVSAQAGTAPRAGGGVGGEGTGGAEQQEACCSWACTGRSPWEGGLGRRHSTFLQN